MKPARQLACGVGFLLLAAGGSLPAGTATDGIAAITKPSEDVTLSFVKPGRIAKVFVKEGDTVKADQLLIEQDDAAEKALFRRLQAEANSTVQVRASEAKLAQTKVDCEKVEEAGRKGATSAMEVAHAQLDVRIAELSLELARSESNQAVFRCEEARVQLDRMRLASPIAGKVEKVLVQEGESRDAQQPVVRVVKIDPLWIDVPVPLAQARRLAVGAPAVVEFPPDANARAAGTIVHVAAVADAASDTLIVRVEVSNPSLRQAGEHVRVRFDATAVGASRPAGPKPSAPTNPKETVNGRTGKAD